MLAEAFELIFFSFVLRVFIFEWAEWERKTQLVLMKASCGMIISEYTIVRIQAIKSLLLTASAKL